MGTQGNYGVGSESGFPLSSPYLAEKSICKANIQGKCHSNMQTKWIKDFLDSGNENSDALFR